MFQNKIQFSQFYKVWEKFYFVLQYLFHLFYIDYLVGNLSIVWEEITRAIEPIIYDFNNCFELQKPFTFLNNNNKEYDLYYVEIQGDLSLVSWKNSQIISTGKKLKHSGRLEYFYVTTSNIVKIAIITSIQEGVSKLVGSKELNPTSIVFYGGYIK